MAIEDRGPCGICRYPIDVTIRVKNELTDSPFKLEETIRQEPQQTLIRFLERAVEQDIQFKFTAIYFKNLGYFIESINGLSGSNFSAFWKISSLPTGAALQCGVSSYVPENGETLLFDLVPIPAQHP